MTRQDAERIADAICDEMWGNPRKPHGNDCWKYQSEDQVRRATLKVLCPPAKLEWRHPLPPVVAESDFYRIHVNVFGDFELHHCDQTWQHISTHKSQCKAQIEAQAHYERQADAK